jgi:hypothetical protein
MHPNIPNSNSLHSHKRIKIYIPMKVLLALAFVADMKYSSIKKVSEHDPKIVVSRLVGLLLSTMVSWGHFVPL